MKTTLLFFLSAFSCLSFSSRAAIFEFSWSKKLVSQEIFFGGCTDSGACNYDPGATFDDGTCCYDNCVEIDISSSAFPAEVGFILFDESDVEILNVPNNGAPFNEVVCLPNGCYHFQMIDEFGDGWNGAAHNISIVGGATIASGGFPNLPVNAAFENNVYFTIGGGVLGCTNATACNYNPAATCDNGTCDFVTCYGCIDSEACNFNASAIFDDGSCCMTNCVDLVMIDYVGDGWNNGYYEIKDDMGVLVSTGTLDETKSYDELSLCLEDGCYTFELFGGEYPEEIEWSLVGVNDGPILGDGISSTFVYFSLGSTECFGCTDEAACTYNPFAIVDDGSCIAGPCVAYDNPWTAHLINPTAFPAVSNFSGILNGATPSQVARTASATGEDVWFRFVAQSTGARFTANSTVTDLAIVLVDDGYRKLKESNLRTGVGLEALNTDELEVGRTYYVGVRNTNSALGAGTFSFTAARLRAGLAANAALPYSICGNLKTQWTGASQFNFHFQDAVTLEDIYFNSSSTTIFLSAVPGLRYNRQYNLGVSSTFSLPNSLGMNETYFVEYTIPVTINIGLPPQASLTSSFSCSNYGPVTQSTWLSFNPRSCGITGYQFELTNQDGIQAPITYNHNSVARLFRLNMIPGVQNGATYDFRIRPMFSYDYTAAWGPAVCLQVAGTSSFWTVSNNLNEELSMSEEDEVSFAASAYPNPNNGEQVAIIIDSDESKEIFITIHDLTGRLVFSTQVVSEGELNFELPLDKKLATGVYSVNFVSGSEKHSQRLIVRNN
jgi:hypothetical protein